MVMSSQEVLEQCFRLLDEGASLRDLEAKFNIPKSTLQRLYAKRLEKLVEKRRKTLTELEEEIARLKAIKTPSKNRASQWMKVSMF